MTNIIIPSPAHRLNSFAQLADSQTAREVLGSGRWFPWFDRSFLHVVAQHGLVGPEGRERLAALAGRGRA